MQEIVPHLNQIWLNLDGEDVSSSCFDIDTDNFKDITSHCIKSDIIVVTIFTIPLIRYVKMLRERMGLSFRFVFHLHGFATFGCWPLYYWNFGDLLTRDDVFVASSSMDFVSFTHYFKDIRCPVIPFSLPRPKLIRLMPQDEIPFVYVGRLSEQKHLEVILQSLALYKAQNSHFKFHIYGVEDGLGWPHLGKKGMVGYQEELKKLSHSLGLENNVFFHGFVQREIIDKEWEAKKVIMLISSLHSDENFGMAAFRCLLHGNQAVLTQWGGHVDLKKNFGDRVDLVVVNKGKSGPVVCHQDFLEGVKSAVAKYWQELDTQIPSAYYNLEDQYQKILMLETLKGKATRPEVVDVLLKNLENYRQNPDLSDGCQIFDGHNDPLALQFAKLYGMK